MSSQRSQENSNSHYDSIQITFQKIKIILSDRMQVSDKKGRQGEKEGRAIQGNKILGWIDMLILLKMEIISWVYTYIKTFQIVYHILNMFICCTSVLPQYIYMLKIQINDIIKNVFDTKSSGYICAFMPIDKQEHFLVGRFMSF